LRMCCENAVRDISMHDWHIRIHRNGLLGKCRITNFVPGAS
jgi:hypothetical protein